MLSKRCKASQYRDVQLGKACISKLNELAKSDDFPEFSDDTSVDALVSKLADGRIAQKEKEEKARQQKKETIAKERERLSNRYLSGETNTSVELNSLEFEIGDFVRWDGSGPSYGQIKKISTGSAFQDEREEGRRVRGTQEDPAALIMVYEGKGNNAQPTGTRVARRFSALEPWVADGADAEASGSVSTDSIKNEQERLRNKFF